MMKSSKHVQDGQQRMVPKETETRLETYPMGWRHTVTLLAFIGFVCMYSMRINLGVALVAMVNHTAVVQSGQNETKATSICSNQPDSTHSGQMNYSSSHHHKSSDGKFLWSGPLQSFILSSFFCGYIMTQFIGGVISNKYGAKWVFGLGNGLQGFFTLLSPIAAEAGVGAFLFVRILQGVCSGVTWPSMQTFFSRWAPPSERSTLPALAYAGSFLGTPLTFLFSGLLIDSGFLGGWPSAFYVFGFITCVWFFFWISLSSSGPENHRFISDGERAYIIESLRSSTSAKKPGFSDVPWKKALSSMAVWAVVVAHFTNNWGLYTLMTTLPTYFKKVLGFDIKKNGLLSALPYLTQFILHIGSGRLADFLRVKFNLKTVHIRKVFDCLGHFLPALFITILGFVGCNATAAVAILILTVGSTGFCGAGWYVNFLDIAPQYAGILFGVSNTFSTIPGIAGPSLTVLLTTENTVANWRIAFFIIAALYAFSSVFFAIFAQGTVQPWAVADRPVLNPSELLPLTKENPMMMDTKQVLASSPSKGAMPLVQSFSRDNAASAVTPTTTTSKT